MHSDGCLYNHLFSVLIRKQQRLWRGGGRGSVGECRGLVYVSDEAVPHPGFLHVQKEGQSVTDRARQNREQDRGTDEREVQREGFYECRSIWFYKRIRVDSFMYRATVPHLQETGILQPTSFGLIIT